MSPKLIAALLTAVAFPVAAQAATPRVDAPAAPTAKVERVKAAKAQDKQARKARKQKKDKQKPAPAA